MGLGRRSMMYRSMLGRSSLYCRGGGGGLRSMLMGSRLLRRRGGGRGLCCLRLGGGRLGGSMLVCYMLDMG